MRSRTLVLAFSLLLSIPATVHAKSYSADRFDSHIQLLHGGAIEVTETVVFRFDGTFSEVFRQIPRRRTDGIDVIRASMDGAAFPEGTTPGHFDVSSDNGLRVRWHFSPVSDTIHTFELTYIVRGVVQQSDAGDLLAWRALPDRHDYTIAASTIDIELPAEPAAPPTLRSNRVASARASSEGTSVFISASGIRRDGWVETSIVMARGSAIAAPPAWQARALRARALAPIWLIGAGAVFIVGLLVLFGLRQGYDSPHSEGHVEPRGPDLPDALPPAIAGALVSNGRSSLEHAMATLFTLAERGGLTIVEKPKRWGQRRFELRRTPVQQPRSEYEKAVLDAAFTGRGPEDVTDLGSARWRLTRRMSHFSSAVQRHMLDAGLLDEGRLQVRNRFAWVAFGALILAGVALIPAALLIGNYGAWPMVIPMALGAVAAIAGMTYSAHTPLSNEGVRRRHEWLRFQKYLRQVTRDRATITDPMIGRLLPFAIATGLAAGWGAYLKKHPGQVPPWFQALATDRGGQGFAYFVTTGGSGTSGHGGAGAGGAAGGGASGAH